MKGSSLANIALWGSLAAMLAPCAGEPAAKALAAAGAQSRTAPPRTLAAAAVVQPSVPMRVPANPLADPGSNLAERSVFYDFDAYTAKLEFRPVIEAHADYLAQHPGASVIIVGNCDERGSREYNLALGQRRADDLERLMVELGASERQVETVSFGEEKPRAAGHEESSWEKNRRSDIVYKREQ